MPEQIVKVYESTLLHIDSIDKRHFEFALVQAQKKDAAGKRHVFIGGLIAAVGLICAYSLAASGHEVVARAIVTFLATIIAVVVGSKLLN